MPDIMCKQEGAALLQSLSATALLTGSEGTEVVWTGVSSPSASGGVGRGLLSLSLGKVVGERGAETEGESPRGASPSSSR